jgi:hypothetical protein
MNHKTKTEYLKLAIHSISVNVIDKNIQPSEKNVGEALIAVATKHRPAYWCTDQVLMK